MKVWLGHYVGKPREWFVAWGGSKLEAAAHVAEQWGEPELRSMRPVEGPGGFSVVAEEVRAEGEVFPMLLASHDGEPVDASLGVDAGVDENEAWVLARMRAPLATEAPAPPAVDLFALQEEPPVQVLVGGELVESDCDCIAEAEVVNDPCAQHVEAEATPGRCLVCEHEPGCHPRLGVRR